MSRRALSLLELVVVLAILATIIVLLLPAVHKVRDAAAGMQGMNNLKQVSLAIQGFAEGHGGQLPVSDGGYHSAYYKILPWLDHGSYYAQVESGARPYSSDYEMKLYLSPKDPTLLNAETRLGKASYCYNAQVFVVGVAVQPNPTMTNAFPDGLSNTITVAEHFADCSGTQFLWIWSRAPLTIPHAESNSVLTARRSSFADVGDVTPNPANPPAITFQVRPKIAECDPRIPQTAFDVGLLTALADGSVRVVHPGVSRITFWSAVWPDGGEVLGPNW